MNRLEGNWSKRKIIIKSIRLQSFYNSNLSDKLKLMKTTQLLQKYKVMSQVFPKFFKGEQANQSHLSSKFGHESSIHANTDSKQNNSFDSTLGKFQQNFYDHIDNPYSSTYEQTKESQKFKKSQVKKQPQNLPKKSRLEESSSDDEFVRPPLNTTKKGPQKSFSLKKPPSENNEKSKDQEIQEKAIKVQQKQIYQKILPQKIVDEKVQEQQQKKIEEKPQSSFIRPQLPNVDTLMEQFSEGFDTMLQKPYEQEYIQKQEFINKNYQQLQVKISQLKLKQEEEERQKQRIEKQTLEKRVQILQTKLEYEIQQRIKTKKEKEALEKRVQILSTKLDYEIQQRIKTKEEKEALETRVKMLQAQKQQRKKEIQNLQKMLQGLTVQFFDFGNSMQKQ